MIAFMLCVKKWLFATKLERVAALAANRGTVENELSNMAHAALIVICVGPRHVSSDVVQ